jgi:hypothetical protein
MVFAILAWAEVTPASIGSWRRMGVSRKPTNSPFFAGALFTLGLGIVGFNLYSLWHPTHPRAAWTTVSILLVSILAGWLLVWRGPSKPTAPTAVLEPPKQSEPSSPKEMREQVLSLAGDLCALLIRHGKELDPTYKDDGFAGLGPLSVDEPEIKAEFISMFGTRISEIKTRLGERGLLGEKLAFSSIGDALDSSPVRNADGVRDIIKCLALAAKIIEEKFIRGVSLSVASHARTAAVIAPSKDDVFELIWRLKEFHKSLSPCPGVPNSLPDLTADNADRYVTQVTASIRAWSNQIRHSYAERFSAPVNELIHKLGSKGLDVRALEEYSRCVETDENVSSVIEALQKVASGLAGR